MRGFFPVTAVVLALLLAGCVADEGDATESEASLEDLAESAATLTGPTYRSCTASQKNMISTALSSAEQYAVAAVSYLDAGTDGPRYTTWFGSYTSSRYATVRAHFIHIKNTIQTKSITFDCSCSEDEYAFVLPDRPYVINLCNAFWSAPTTGTDSKAGTIIDALSHFHVVASTDDWTYGHSSCKSLATSDPAKAIDNADSYEYFAENRPAQN